MSILDITDLIQDNTTEILEWLKDKLINSGYNWEQIISQNKIEIVNGVINFKGNLTLKYCGDFPDYIKFGRIDGSFNCSHCNLTTLRGVPDIIEGSFDCSLNKLKNLKNGPSIVKGSYYAQNNQLTDILPAHNLPKKLNVFNVSYNEQLKDISGLYNMNIASLYIRDCKNVCGAENIERISFIFPFGSTKLVEELKFFNIKTFE